MTFPARLLRPFLISVALAVALYAVAMIAGDLKAVSSAAARLGLTGWLMILGLSMVNYGLRFVRWQGYLTHLGARVPTGRHAAYYLAGFAFTTTPGKAGEAVRSLYLKRHGVAYSRSFAALVVERLMDVAAMALLAIGAAWVFELGRWPVVAAAALVLSLLPLLRSRALLAGLDRLARRGSPSKRSVLLGHLGDMVRASAGLLGAVSIYGGLALGLVAWGAEGVGLYVILNYLGMDTSLLIAVGVYAVAILAGALSFIPGGLGSTEAVMVLLLGLMGSDMATAVAATLICRIVTLWFAVAIGLLAIAGLEAGGERLTEQEASGLTP